MKLRRSRISKPRHPRSIVAIIAIAIAVIQIQIPTYLVTVSGIKEEILLNVSI